MTNAEAIEQLKAIRSDYRDDLRNFPELVKDDVEALDLAISALSRDRWVSVEEPPDTNRFVLVMNDDGRCGVAQYVGDDIAPFTPWQIAYCLYDVDTWDDEEQGPVCWWRELPEPPKEDKP